MCAKKISIPFVDSLPINDALLRRYLGQRFTFVGKPYDGVLFELAEHTRSKGQVVLVEIASWLWRICGHCGCAKPPSEFPQERKYSKGPVKCVLLMLDGIECAVEIMCHAVFCRACRDMKNRRSRTARAEGQHGGDRMKRKVNGKKPSKEAQELEEVLAKFHVDIPFAFTVEELTALYKKLAGEDHYQTRTAGATDLPQGEHNTYLKICFDDLRKTQPRTSYKRKRAGQVAATTALPQCASSCSRCGLNLEVLAAPPGDSNDSASSSTTTGPTPSNDFLDDQGSFVSMLFRSVSEVSSESILGGDHGLYGLGEGMAASAGLELPSPMDWTEDSNVTDDSGREVTSDVSDILRFDTDEMEGEMDVDWELWAMFVAFLED